MNRISVEIDEIGLCKSHTSGISAAEGTRKVITDHAPAFWARDIDCGVASGLNGEVFRAHHQVGNRNVISVSVTTPESINTFLSTSRSSSFRVYMRSYLGHNDS